MKLIGVIMGRDREEEPNLIKLWSDANLGGPNHLISHTLSQVVIQVLDSPPIVYAQWIFSKQNDNFFSPLNRYSLSKMRTYSSRLSGSRITCHWGTTNLIDGKPFWICLNLGSGCIISIQKSIAKLHPTWLYGDLTDYHNCTHRPPRLKLWVFETT